ncbi:MAG TPA: hypothetical protein VKU02_08910 [Gemmataceae bacterium]|nr:hypothetical protein [Gemmataceae bacterium]
MPEMREASIDHMDAAQAAELSLLVDLEARWDNLRRTRLQPPEGESGMQDLQGKQKAYESFHAKLVAYNKKYRPAHVPELLLNTPSRLARWCQTMRSFYLRLEHDPRGHCPVHLLEKAYQWADRVAIRMNKGFVRRSTPPDTIGAAIRDLEELGHWCDEVAKVASPGEQSPG